MDTNNKILIIDDERDLIRMLGFQFKAQGFDVKTALDGLAGLEVLEKFRPDLIILDINMPGGMGGIEFYSKICGSNGKPLYPVLVLTARANIHGLFQDLQIDGFVIKPFETDQLIHEACLIIKKRSQQEPEKKSILGGARKICIVDNDQQIFDKLGSLFLNADYSVMPARSGATAVEKIMKEVPDVALVHLGLTDFPGDIVIYRLSQMSKTMGVKYVLYTSKTAEHEPRVMERISIKTGIFTFVEYDKLEEILDTVNHLLSAG